MTSSTTPEPDANTVTATATERQRHASDGASTAAGRAPRDPRAVVLSPRRGRSFFEIYKPGQGRYTRMGTAIGGGILVAGAGNFLYANLESIRSDQLWTLLVQLLVPVVLVVGLGLLLYWIVAVNRTCCDFFIATEGEMKKVSWSSRNELVGSTKVVIACTILLGLLLFVVDALFIKFFQFIGVLWSVSQG